MRSHPTLLIRPLARADLRLIHKWRTMRDWPHADKRQGAEDILSARSQDVVMVAEPPGETAIGLAYLALDPGYPDNVAQYSVAIPEPTERSIGRGRDLLVLSIGAAFYVYGLRELFVLLNAEDGILAAMCRQGGFRALDRGYIRCSTDAAPLALARRDYVRKWGREFLAKVPSVPWLIDRLDTSTVSRELQEVAGRETTPGTECLASRVNRDGFPVPPKKVFA